MAMIVIMVMVVMLMVSMAGAVNLLAAVIMLQSENLRPLAGPHDVDRTGEAGVEGVDHPHHFHRLAKVLHRGADQGLLDGT